MSYKLYPTEEFQKHAQKIAGVYPHFKNDLFELAKKLKKDPLSVPGLDPLGDGLYKCRVEITGKSAGKSYGARVIYLLITADAEVWVMTCYDKSNKKGLRGKELADLRKKAKTAQKAKPGSDRDTLLESIHLRRKKK